MQTVNINIALAFLIHQKVVKATNTVNLLDNNNYTALLTKLINYNHKKVSERRDYIEKKLISYVNDNYATFERQLNDYLAEGKK